MSLEDKWFDWDLEPPDGDRELDPGLSGTRVLPMPCGLTAVLSEIKATEQAPCVAFLLL